MKLKELKNYLDSFLELHRFKSDRFNGLKVRGRSEVNKLGFAANCTFQVIDNAIKDKVDFLLVHHGGWKETDSELARQKWSKLKSKKISLYIAHASLDGNKQFGTSKILADLLDLNSRKPFGFYHGGFAGVCGVTNPISLNALKKRLEKKLKTKAKAFKNNNKTCRRIAIVAGGAGGITPAFLKEAKRLNCDTFIGGSAEIFQAIYAKENRINLLLTGHTATEQPAVKALAKHLAKKFRIKVIQMKEECF